MIYNIIYSFSIAIILLFFICYCFNNILSFYYKIQFDSKYFSRNEIHFESGHLTLFRNSSYKETSHLCFNSTIKFPKSDALDVFDKCERVVHIDLLMFCLSSLYSVEFRPVRLE